MWRNAVYRDKLAKIILLTILFPFVIYMLGSCIIGYIPPTGSYRKAPYQFEELFNEKMAKYGMSIDIDSVNFSYGDGLSKTVPIKCEDGSMISCTYYPTSERRKSLIEYMTFTQELTGQHGETTYIEQLLIFMLEEFYTASTDNKDEPFDAYSGVSYNEALRICKEFIRGEEKETSFFVWVRSDHGTATTLERKVGETSTISISFLLPID